MRIMDYVTLMTLGVGLLVISSIAGVLIIAKEIQCGKGRWTIIIFIAILSFIILIGVIYGIKNYVYVKKQNVNDYDKVVVIF